MRGRLTMGATVMPDLGGTPLSYSAPTDPGLPGLAPTAYNPRRQNTTAAMLGEMAGSGSGSGTTAPDRAAVVAAGLGGTLTRSRLLTMPAGGDRRLRGIDGGMRAGNTGGMRGRWDVGDMRRPNIDIERVEAWGTQGRVWAPSWDVL